MRRTLDLFFLRPNKNMMPCRKRHKIVNWKRISSPVNEQFLEPTFLIPLIEYSISDKDWTWSATIDLYRSIHCSKYDLTLGDMVANGANGATLNRTWSLSISHNMHCKSRMIINVACPQTNHIWHSIQRFFKENIQRFFFLTEITNIFTCCFRDPFYIIWRLHQFLMVFLQCVWALWFLFEETCSIWIMGLTLVSL